MANWYGIVNPIYQPAMRVIASISQSNPVTVTTAIDHLYITGTIVRIDIPHQLTGQTQLGMPQINEQFAPITVTSPTAFTMPIDTTNYDAFAIPSPLPQGYVGAQSVPIGEINSILTAAVVNTLNPT